MSGSIAYVGVVYISGTLIRDRSYVGDTSRRGVLIHGIAYIGSFKFKLVVGCNMESCGGAESGIMWWDSRLWSKDVVT